MTLTSFDLISDFDGSIQKTFNETDFDAAVLHSIHELGYVLLTNHNENGVFECDLIEIESGDSFQEFVSHSLEAANVEALTLLGYSIFESLTEAELNSVVKDDDSDEWEDSDEPFEVVESGKIIAFEL